MNSTEEMDQDGQSEDSDEVILTAYEELACVEKLKSPKRRLDDVNEERGSPSCPSPSPKVSKNDECDKASKQENQDPVADQCNPESFAQEQTSTNRLTTSDLFQKKYKAYFVKACFDWGNEENAFIAAEEEEEKRRQEEQRRREIFELELTTARATARAAFHEKIFSLELNELEIREGKDMAESDEWKVRKEWLRLQIDSSEGRYSYLLEQLKKVLPTS